MSRWFQECSHGATHCTWGLLFGSKIGALLGAVWIALSLLLLLWWKGSEYSVPTLIEALSCLGVACLLWPVVWVCMFYKVASERDATQLRALGDKATRATRAEWFDMETRFESLSQEGDESLRLRSGEDSQWSVALASGRIGISNEAQFRFENLATMAGETMGRSLFCQKEYGSLLSEPDPAQSWYRLLLTFGISSAMTYPLRISRIAANFLASRETVQASRRLGPYKGERWTDKPKHGIAE